MTVVMCFFQNVGRTSHPVSRVRFTLAVILTAFALAPVPVEAQLQVPSDAEYVASSQGRVYYWVGCSAWTRLKASNLRFFESTQQAEEAGYTPSRSRGCAGPDDGARDRAPDLCVVQRVVDGDTFACRSGVRVRLLLIDAPESSQGGFGLRAKLALEELTPEGRAVELRYDVQESDRYGRALAHVYSDGLWVNRALVRDGYALVAVYPPNVRGVEAMRAAADSARAEEAGLWRLEGFRCVPADHRRGRC